MIEISKAIQGNLVMSSFYFCHDCKKAVDLKIGSKLQKYNSSYITYDGIKICKECNGTNWEVRNA